MSSGFEGSALHVPVKRPAVTLIRRADQLAQFFAEHRGTFSVDDVPPVGDEVAEQLDEIGLATYNCHAARAVDIAHFAVFMRGSGPTEEVQEAVAASRDADFLQIPVELPDDVAERMSNLPSLDRPTRATLCFGLILAAAAEDFVADRSSDELANLREYERHMYQAAEGNLASDDLVDAYRTGINTLAVTTNQLLGFYGDVGSFSQPATRVIRNSTSARRTLAAATRSLHIELQGVNPELFGKAFLVAVTGTDEERIDVSRTILAGFANGRKLCPAAEGRTDNACVAIAPVLSISSESAIETLNGLQIQTMEAVEGWTP